MSRTLHPEAKAALDRLDAESVPPLHSLSVDDARETLLDLSDTEPTQYGDETVRDVKIPGPSEELPVRLYEPAAAGSHSARNEDRPILLYIHGGGWALGSLDSVDGLCRLLAVESSCLVASVSYRRAPEHQFPAQLHDCFSALEWIQTNARSVGGDPTRIAVGGDSAGGNLAGALAMYTHEFDGPELSFQLLFYPVTNYAFDTNSYEQNATGYYLTRKDMKQFWEYYLGTPVHGYNPFASPLRYDDPTTFPPTYLLTCEFDPLRDEGRAFATKLENAGVPVIADHEQQMIHGFIRHVTRMESAKRAARRAGTILADHVSE